jgi:translation initiation factor IF-2
LAKVRVFSLAKELGIKSNSLIKALAHMGVSNLTAASAIDEEMATVVRELLAEQVAKARERAKEAEEADKPQAVSAKPTDAATTQPAASAGKREVTAEPEEDTSDEEIRRQEKELAQLEQELAGREFGPGHPGAHLTLEELEQRFEEATQAPEKDQDPTQGAALPQLGKRPSGERPADAIDVPPVVTVLGHVDHGKTSLLDALRSTNVVGGESGGITQHIGASELEVGDKSIVFIDTPGHEAFTAIRARGAQVTDMAVLVVAADDGVMPQTTEAINHAKAAEVPILVAINKCDLPTANPERVKQQLLDYELVPEEWGGDTIVVEISAETGDGLDDLVEMILLLAEVEELWAEPDADFVGVVIEAGVDPNQGAMATVLIRNGTLHLGDAIVVGPNYGRVRSLRDWQGNSLKEMGPGRPVEVLGLSGPPDAGEIVTSAKGPKEARQAAAERELQVREIDMDASRAAALRELFAGMQEGEVADLNCIIKADVFGSGQALAAKLGALDAKMDEVDVTVMHMGVGPVNESDVMLARASDAIILGFNVEVPPSVRQTAEAEKVEIRLYDVIYEAIEDIVAAASGLLEPIVEERALGTAEVLQIFRSSRAGVVAGCRVTDRSLRPGAKIRVLRNGEVVHTGTIDSLRRFDRDVSEVQAPSECGLSSRGYRGWQEGDVIEASTEVEIERRVTMGSGVQRVE